MKNILMLTRLMGQGGTEKIFIQQCSVLKDAGYNLVACSGGGFNVSTLEKMGIKHYTVNDLEDKSPFKVLSNLLIINKIIKQNQVDVIHTHHRMAAVYARLLARKNNAIHVHTAHNIFHDKVALTKFALGDCSDVVAVGNSVKNNLVEDYGISPEKVKVIYNAVQDFLVSEKKIDDTISRLTSEGKIVVGNYGRLTEQKNFEMYIRAISKLKDKDKFAFLIVGDGELKGKLKKMVTDLGLIELVYFLGYRNDIQNVLSQTDFTVISSKWEGLPLVPIESFSVGKAVIGTNIGGTNELIKESETGILVESDNEIELSKKISLLANDEKLLRKIETNITDNYDREYSFDVFAKKYLELYHNLLMKID